MNIQFIKGVLTLARPKAWIWFIFLSSFGMATVLLQGLPPKPFVFLVIAILLSDAGSCMLNDVGDLDADLNSTELSRLNRPIVRGIVKPKEALLIGSFLYGCSLLLAYSINHVVFIMIGYSIMLGVLYSLKPLKLNGRKSFTQPFWIIIWVGYYLLIVFYLEKIDFNFFRILFETGETNLKQLNHEGALLTSIPGIIFILAIIFFMGIAEILAKDLRDLHNDKKGGKNTFVGYLGAYKTASLIPPFAVIGLLLWNSSLYLNGAFLSAVSFLVPLIGVIWYILLVKWCRIIKLDYHQPTAASIHRGFIISYALMQFFTIASFL